MLARDWGVLAKPSPPFTLDRADRPALSLGGRIAADFKTVT